IHLADRMGMHQLGLDASDQGRPIYAKLGFVPTARINRWSGRATVDLQRQWKRAKPDWPRIADCDRRATALDRQRLLRDIEADTEVFLASIDHKNQTHTYGMVRPGRNAWHIGPVVSSDQSTAAQILNHLIGHPNEQPTEPSIIDVIECSPIEPLL